MLPFSFSFGLVTMGGPEVPFWVPLPLVAAIVVGISCVAWITAAPMLRPRLASFVGLIEVVAASVCSWLLLGEALTPLQVLGRVVNLVGIGFVRSEKEPEVRDAVGIPRRYRVLEAETLEESLDLKCGNARTNTHAKYGLISRQPR